MSIKTKIFNQEILSSIEEYLKVYPDELNKLNTVIEQLKTDQQDLFSRNNFKGHLTGSGLLYNKANNKVLLVHHRSLNIWIQPGGHLDPFEKPLCGALREFQEETKIRNVKIDDWHSQHNIPIDIDTHFIPKNPRKGEPEHFHHDFLYLLAGNDNTSFAVELAETELNAYKWVDLYQLETGPFEEKLKRAATKIRSYLSL